MCFPDFFHHHDAITKKPHLGLNANSTFVPVAPWSNGFPRTPMPCAAWILFCCYVGERRGGLSARPARPEMRPSPEKSPRRSATCLGLGLGLGTVEWVKGSLDANLTLVRAVVKFSHATSGKSQFVLLALLPRGMEDGDGKKTEVCKRDRARND